MKKLMPLLTILVLVILVAGCAAPAAPAPAEQEAPPAAEEPAAEEEAPVAEEEPTVEPEPEAESELVELDWYYPIISTANVPDLQMIEDMANEIITPEINAVLKLHPTDIGEYNEKLNTMSAGGDPYDMAYTSWWTFKYFDLAPLGAFAGLNELLDEHAPTIQAELPAYVFQANTIDGESYAVPHVVNAAGPYGWVLDAASVEKYGFDLETVTDFASVEPLIAEIAANDPDLIPMVSGPPGYWEAYSAIAGFDKFRDIVGGNMFGYRLADDGVEVINLYDTPEYMAYAQQMNDWWDKGYIQEDAPTTANTADVITAGKAGSFTNRNLLAPEGVFGGKTYYNAPLGGAVLHNNVVLAHQTAVGRNSDDPARAVMLLELMRANPDLWRLLTYGIEGTHYTVNADGQIERIADAGYNNTFDWMFGDFIKHGYRPAGEAPAYMENFNASLESGEQSKLLGFVLDKEPVAAELAQIQAIHDQFIPQISTGAGNTEELIPQFMEQLELSGLQNVIDEVQSQVDAWQSGQ